MNTDTKNLLQSKTLWGVIIAAAPTILGLFGLQVSDVGTFGANASGLVDDGITLFGSVLAIYGRFKATKALVVKKAAP